MRIPEIITASHEAVKGKHILEVIRNVELIEALKESSERPNEAVEKALKSAGRNATVVSVKDSNGTLVGTIITFN